MSLICFLKALLGRWWSSLHIEFQSLALNLAKEPWFWFSLNRLMLKLQEEENLVSWLCFSFALVKRLLMLVGTFRHETSNIIEETISMYNIFTGRIFEEVNKGTACALFEKSSNTEWLETFFLFVLSNLAAANASLNPARTQYHFVYERRWKLWTKEGRAHWQVCFQLL